MLFSFLKINECSCLRIQNNKMKIRKTAKIKRRSQIVIFISS